MFEPVPQLLLKYDEPYVVTETPADRAIREAEPVPAAHERFCEIREVLNAIRPPIEFEKDDMLWIQQVSAARADRTDAERLNEKLNSLLQEKQARQVGICPMRRELYSQCFDELIRQITIDCPERGVLLLRIREELQHTLAAHQALYVNSVRIGERKTIMAEESQIELNETIGLLGDGICELKRQIVLLKVQIQKTEHEAVELQQAQERKYIEEIEFLKRINDQYVEQMELIQKMENEA
ncbi:33 kDa inner dynein arm light chain, axonemal-like [Schistocerca cancellata]|uniref:33 kDa inner dynein arm light chain, axonemal-like n=1 Tax=Schistocerca cancellata TaxID=274614 RepID=UPI002117E1C5|nr:33 kDa inner dynein arm light chain, axonemal-like [Schistocerca cancellata]